MMNKNDTINILMFLTKNIKKYIPFYDEKELKSYALQNGLDCIDAESYNYNGIVTYIMKNSPIAKRYSSSRLHAWISRGYPFIEETKEENVDYDTAYRDVRVLVDEIRYLYVIKNWELCKNIYYTTDQLTYKQYSLTIDKCSYLTYPMEEKVENTKVFACLNDESLDNVCFHKEENDSCLVCAMVTEVKDKSQSFPMLTLLYTTRVADKDIERPYMFFNIPLRSNDVDTIQDVIDRDFSIDKPKYEDFMTRYKHAVEEVCKYILYINVNDSKSENKNEAFRLPRSSDFIKNNYREIYIAEIG